MLKNTINTFNENVKSTINKKFESEVEISIIPEENISFDNNNGFILDSSNRIYNYKKQKKIVLKLSNFLRYDATNLLLNFTGGIEPLIALLFRENEPINNNLITNSVINITNNSNYYIESRHGAIRKSYLNTNNANLSDNITIDNPNLFNSHTQSTISFWINLISMSSQIDIFRIRYGSDFFSILVNDNNKIVIQHNGSAESNFTLTSDTTLNNDQYYHVMVILSDSQNIELYIDNTQDSYTTSGTLTLNFNLSLLNTFTSGFILLNGSGNNHIEFDSFYYFDTTLNSSNRALLFNEDSVINQGLDIRYNLGVPIKNIIQESLFLEEIYDNKVVLDHIETITIQNDKEIIIPFRFHNFPRSKIENLTFIKGDILIEY